MHAGEDEFAGQRKFRGVSGHPRSKVELLGHDTDGIVGRPGGHFDHNVGVENVRGEKDPENVVDEEASQQERRHFEAWQSDESDERHTQTHSHGWKARERERENKP